MAVIPADAGLLSGCTVFVIFGFMNICFPVSFLAQYKLDLNIVHTNVTNVTTNVTSSTAITTSEKLLISTSLQYMGLNMLTAAATNTITFRGGTDDQKSAVCLMNAASSTISTIITLSTVSYWTDLGVSATGLYINAGLFFVLALVNVLAVSPPAFKLARIGKPLYWGFLGIIPVYLFYMFTMFFATDFLFKSYGVELGGNPQKVLAGLFKFGVAPSMLQLILLFIAQIIAPGPLATYGVVRWMAVQCFGSFMTSAIAAAVWTCRNVDGSYDKIISGQNFNMLLWLIFWAAFYVPVVQMDPALKDTVEKEIGATATPVKKAKKKKATEAEPAAALVIDEVVQPLLPPMFQQPMSQTLVPSYSMVQQPQMTYASYASPATTAYAAPATYAAAPMAYAPATTAYAAPATYSTGFAAPAFGTTAYTAGGVV